MMEEKINLEELMLLKQRFEEADEDGSGGIELEEFVESFGPLLGDHLTPLQLKHLFMKIDADSNGNIDWDEFSNYMFLEKKSEEPSSNDAYKLSPQDFTDNNGDPTVAHRDIVEQIRFIPCVDKYVTSSHDGTFRLWNGVDLQHFRTISNTKAWITDSVYLPLSKKMVFSAMDRSISFYEVARTAFELTGRLYTSGSMGVPLCLTSAVLHGKECIIFGDSKGGVKILQAGMKELPARDIYKTDVISLTKDHTDWITKVQYIPEMSVVASSSLDGTVKLSDLNNPGRVRLSAAVHRRGVNNFDWCHAYSMFASCGVERDILLWHSATGRKMGVLSGHMASVQNVVINAKLNQLISISVDKVIKVWDLRTHKCVQTVVDNTVHRPENRITAVMYDTYRSRLVTATSKPSVWPQTCTAKVYTGHEYAVCAALYNPDFSLVVSADESCTVCVWHINDGERAGRYGNAHDSKITAMTFDHSGRRLLTAANDGTIKMFNYNNGQLLKVFSHSYQMCEVTDLLYVSDAQRDAKLILAVGWNQVVLVWEEVEDEFEMSDFRSMHGHEEDILCVAYSAPNTIATGDYGGNIIIWSLSTGAKKKELRKEYDKDSFYERSIEKLVFLNEKKHEGMPMLLAGGGDGKLTCWSQASLSGMLRTETHAAYGPSGLEAVSAACTDSTNNFVFVGDTAGHARVYDISQIDLVEDFSIDKSFITVSHWRAHKRAVSSIEYIEKQKLVLVASLDSDITLWTIEGGLVGLMGQQVKFNLGDTLTWVDPDAKNVPPLAQDEERPTGEDEVEEEIALESEEEEEEEDIFHPLEHGGIVRGLNMPMLMKRRGRHKEGGTKKINMIHSGIRLHDLQHVPENVHDLKIDLDYNPASAETKH